MENKLREITENTNKAPTFFGSLLLSLPISIGLPYIFLGLSFKFTTCRGGMFCLPTGWDCLFFLFAFPFLIALILLSSLVYATHLVDSLKIASFVAQPLLPFSEFTVVVDPITLFSLLLQVLFWTIIVHWFRVKLRKR